METASPSFANARHNHGHDALYHGVKLNAAAPSGAAASREHLEAGADADAREGPSRRVRGAPVPGAVRRTVGGTIPAGAGSTPPPSSPCEIRRDHPRGCGDDPNKGGAKKSTTACSPRVRGWPLSDGRRATDGMLWPAERAICEARIPPVGVRNPCRTFVRGFRHSGNLMSSGLREAQRTTDATTSPPGPRQDRPSPTAGSRTAR